MKQFFRAYKAAFEGLSIESWMLSLVMLLNRTGGMVIPFLTIYLTSILHFTTHEAGIVMSCFGIGSLLGSIIGGWLTDKFGSFPVQFATLFFAAPFFVLLAKMTNLTEICLTILVMSTIYESFRPANSAAIALYAKKGNITRSFSLNRMAINLGFSFGPALGGFLATFSYAWLFYGNAFAVFVTSIVFFLFFFKRNTKEEQQEVFIGDETTTSPYKDKYFLVFSFFSFLFACVFFQLISILPLYYKSMSISQLHIGLLLAFNGVLVFSVEMFFVSYAEKKWNIYTSLVIGCMMLLCSFGWLVVDNSLVSCYFSMLLLSLSEILVLPFMTTIAAKRSNQKNRGAYMGLNGLSIAAAFIIMPYLATMFIELYSFVYLWYVNVFVLTLVICGFLYVKRKMPISN
jgi:predicted MFS family arabinose efflux permease